jgi:capsid protein
MGDVLDVIAREMVARQPTAQFIIQDRANGAKWPAGLSNALGGGAVDHLTARRHSREAMQDSPLCRAIVERNADVIADIGLRLELAPVIEVLGITREEAAVWAKDVGVRFDLWARDKRQHRAENLNFYQYQRLYQIFQHRDNDMFTRLFYEDDKSLQNPLQFDFLDPDQIRGNTVTTTNGFQNCADGIKRDNRGRETGYQIYYYDSDKKAYAETEIPVRDSKSGRVFMLHGYRPEYAGQGRGYSRLAHAIQEFENITDFSAATIKKAINQSQIVGFVEPSADEDAINPFEGILTNQGAGPAAQAFGTTATGDEIPVVPAERQGITSSYRVPEASMDTPGSMFIANLTKGSKITFPKNTAPGDSYDKFVDAFAGYISASTGTPLEVVLMKFGNNYSASRATLLLFWRVAIGWRYEMAADLLDPIKEMWLAGEIARGTVRAPGWSDPRMRAAWLNCNWIGTPPPDIDPTKTANARKTNLETCVTNLDIEALNYNGSDAATNIEKNRTLYENFPVAPWMITGGQGAGADNGADSGSSDGDDA